MRRILPLLCGLALLPACSLFDNSDPREGVEAASDCVVRLGGEATEEAFEDVEIDGQQVVPTYTYDITKLSLDDIQDLIVAGSDETAGTRGMTSTNETSTAVSRFMEQSVDENGAFFLGRDPALYRVRGEAVAVGEVVSAGCARQMPGMRLLSFVVDVAAAESADDEEAGMEDAS